MNHAEAIEGFEVAIEALLEKLSICEFYSEVYAGVALPSESTVNSQQIQNMVDIALPGLYAAVIVFAIKASTYFKARGTYVGYGVQHIMILLGYTKLSLGVNKLAKMLQSFDLEFQPFIQEIDAKEEVIRGFAGAATMKRIGSMYSSTYGIVCGYNRPDLTHIYRHRQCPL